ncbi:MAG: transcription termination factor Rho [Chloroflexi bacterium]|nr:transcription termination factor Rho [Chloroflexota bacterium]
MNYTELDAKSRQELLDLAQEMGMNNAAALRKEELIVRFLQVDAERQGFVLASGILENTPEGYGFLRSSTLKHGSSDVYVSQSQIRRFALRTGDMVIGQVRPPKEGEKYYGLLRVERVNGIDPDQARARPNYDTLTAVFPRRWLQLETTKEIMSTRMLDLFSPIGKGQRGLIVSPPKAGKTMLMKQIANGIGANSPDVHLMVCLIGERPEEVTDMRRSVPFAEVFAATFDETVEDQTRVAELALERAKRLVETKKDVVILLDGITRLTRAYNLALPSSGRTLSGGIDPVALYPPKRFLGAARESEEGGSLTILATCLVDTGSRMDEVIYEEFKGTGNMELHLERRLAEKRIFPAIDIIRSGTRREELMFDEARAKQLLVLRRMVALLSSSETNHTDVTERVMDRLQRTASNAEFLATLSKAEV